MVKRYSALTTEREMEWPVVEDLQGGYIKVTDYLILQAALKEALEGWEKEWIKRSVTGLQHKRIYELRKLLES
jgi:hypothetical protein